MWMRFCMVKMELGGEKMSKYDVLIDSDAFVGLLHIPDFHHKQVKKIFAKMEKDKLSFVTTSYVVMEVATVLSHKSGQNIAKRFLSLVDKIPTIHISRDFCKAGLDIFSQQNKKGNSVVDCTNVAVMRQFEIEKILSFDKVYEKVFGLEVMK